MSDNAKAIADERMSKMNADLLGKKLSRKIVQSMSGAYVDEVRRGGSLIYLRELLRSRQENALDVAGSAIDLLDTDDALALQSDYGNLLFGETLPVLLWGFSALAASNFKYDDEVLLRLKTLTQEPYLQRIRDQAVKVLAEIER